MRENFTDEHMAWCNGGRRRVYALKDQHKFCVRSGVMADEESFMRWKISTNTVKNTLKTDTKYSHSIRGRPTLKVEERCRNGLQTLREISMGEHL